MNPTTIPDTAAYLYLGLAVIAGVSGLFIVSLVVRTRSLLAALRALNSSD